MARGEAAAANPREPSLRPQPSRDFEPLFAEHIPVQAVHRLPMADDRRELQKSHSIPPRGSESAGLHGKRGPPHVDFHIKGFAELSPDALLFATLASVVSYVPDSCLASLLEDDRVALHDQGLSDSIQEEIAWIISLPMAVWHMFVEGLPQHTAQELRSQAILCGHAAAAYMDRKFLNDARGLPWRLCRGDIAHNLTVLASVDVELHDPIAKKLIESRDF